MIKAIMVIIKQQCLRVVIMIDFKLLHIVFFLQKVT